MRKWNCRNIMTRKRLEQLIDEPFATILCYPRFTEKELKRRVRQLERLEIQELEFVGPKRLLNTQILGKGCVGLVVLARRKNEKIALKIRRIDADRASMLREARLLRKANSVQVGPQLLDASKNFLVMQFVEGDLLLKWFEKGVGISRLKKVLKNIMEQCWRLDTARLDHGELSHGPKHVMIDEMDKPYIVDFETSSTRRRPANVTSISQFLFMSEMSSGISRKLGIENRENIVESLRQYRRNMSRDNFSEILKSCGL
jgi:putative serine/threonine protein kinase